MKKIFRFITVALFAVSLASCSNKDKRSDDVVLLYTTDVHCGVNDNLGYSALEAYKKEMLKDYKYVSLLDAGDYIQGDVIGAFVEKISMSVANSMRVAVTV